MKRVSLSVAACVIVLTLTSNAFGQTASNPDVDKVVQLNNQVLAFNRRGQYSQAVELAKRARSMWRRRAAGRTTLTARASHIIEARGTLSVRRCEYGRHGFSPRSRSASAQSHIASGMAFNLPTAEYATPNFAPFKAVSFVSL